MVPSEPQIVVIQPEDPQLYLYLQPQDNLLPQQNNSDNFTEENIWKGLEVFSAELSILSPPDQVSVVYENYHSCFNSLVSKLKFFLCELNNISYHTETTWEKIDFECKSPNPNSFVLDCLNQDLNVLSLEFNTVNHSFKLVSEQITVLTQKFDFLMTLIQQMSK